MKGSLIFLIALLLCLPWVLEPLVAVRAHAAKSQEKLKDIRKNIKKEERIIKKLAQEKTSLLGSLEALDRKVNQAERKRRISQIEIEKLTKETEVLKRALAALDKKIAVQRRGSASRLETYHRLGQMGILPVLFSESSMPQKFRNMDAMRRILGADWDRLQSYHLLLQEKDKKKKELQSRLDTELLLQEQIRQRKQECVAKRMEKDDLIFRLEQDRERHQQLMGEMKQSADKLAKWLREREEAQRAGTSGTAGSMVSPLGSSKGRLTWPVEGKVCRKFGNYYDPRYQGTIKNRGVDIRTKPDTPVHAVLGGGVAYADWYRGYGKMLIIHHGGKDYSVLSHLGRLTKKEGEAVEVGELVGYAGDTGSTEGCLVHFEIWHDGNPQNPQKWVKKRTKKTARRLK